MEEEIVLEGTVHLKLSRKKKQHMTARKYWDVYFYFLYSFFMSAPIGWKVCRLSCNHSLSCGRVRVAE